jgi:eukaryotic-like serine/threonine-protein kinase
VVKRAVAGDPLHRFATAREMSAELEKCMLPASPSEVGSWVEHLARTVLDDRARRVSEIESTTSITCLPNLSGLALPDDASRIQLTPAPRSIPGMPQRTSTNVRMIVALGVLLLFATVFIAYLLGSNSQHTPASASALPASAAPPHELAWTPPPASGKELSPHDTPSARDLLNEADSPPASSVTATASSAPVPPAPVPPTPRPFVGAPAPHPPTTPIRNTKPAGVNCNPPYTVDAKGHRHFIPECIQ